MYPIVLSDSILEQACKWCDECCNHSCAKVPIKIGEEFLSNTKTLLYISQNFEAKGKTICGLYTVDGNLLDKDGYTIFLNNLNIRQGEWMPTLLHEITHVLDPDFPADLSKTDELSKKGLLESYYYFKWPSELKAFASMWTFHIKDDVLKGKYKNPSVSIAEYKIMPEFKIYYDNISEEYRDILKSHISQIADFWNSKNLL
jgi:hypothetical protein